MFQETKSKLKVLGWSIDTKRNRHVIRVYIQGSAVPMCSGSTYDAWVESLNHSWLTTKTPLVWEATENSIIEFPFLEENPRCLWFLLRSK